MAQGYRAQLGNPVGIAGRHGHRAHRGARSPGRHRAGVDRGYVMANRAPAGRPGRPGRLGSPPRGRAHAQPLPPGKKIDRSGEGLRECGRCGGWYPVGAYRRAGGGRRSGTCRWCRKGDDSAHAARRRAVSGRHTGADVRAIFERQRGRCAWCCCPLWGGYHVDHVMPLSRGGSDDADNLQLMCARCNLRKGAKVGARVGG